MQDNDPTGPALDESQATVPVAYSLDELMQLPVTVLPALDERPSEESLREKPQVYFEDVEVGLGASPVHPTLDSSPTGALGFRNGRLGLGSYFDLDAAVNRHGLPGVVVPDSWKVNAMCRLLKDWALPGGWLWKLDLQHKATHHSRRSHCVVGQSDPNAAPRKHGPGEHRERHPGLRWNRDHALDRMCGPSIEVRAAPPLSLHPPGSPRPGGGHSGGTGRMTGESLRSRWKKRNQT